MREIVDAGGVLRDRSFHLPARGITHAGAAVAIRNADLHDATAGHKQRAVVHVALAAHDDELVAPVGDIGQPVDPRGIEACEARCGAKQDAG
jgi:hypothetical protein